MKHNFKLKERLGALLLAMLFILQAILGLVPVCVTQAAPLTVETWDSDKVVDYGYRFNMKFQPGITTYESFGCDNLDMKVFPAILLKLQQPVHNELKQSAAFNHPQRKIAHPLILKLSEILV